ncbi:MAG: VTT domain-containing protein [Rhodospirillales bacterium]|nr:VTT domain-containing protein [Rhodospirillales bacterium]
MPAKAAPTRTRLLIRGLVLIAAFVAAGLFIRSLEAGQFLNTGWIDDAVRDHGLAGQLVFLAVGALFTAFGLPRQVVCFLGGYGFGFILGTGLALSATVTGCAIAFLFARLAARDLVAERFSRRVRLADAVLGTNPFSVILTIRLLPVGSNLATNLVAGVSSAALGPFVAASALGHLPQTVVFSLVGSGVNVDPGIRLTLGVILFLLSMLLGTHLYFRLRKDATLQGVIEMATGADGTPAAAGVRAPD